MIFNICVEVEDSQKIPILWGLDDCVMWVTMEITAIAISPLYDLI